MTSELRHRCVASVAIAAFIALGWVASPRVSSAEDVRDNLVILLDSSGSMNERLPGTRQDKMSAAKSALTEVLRQLPPTTHVGLIVFGGRGIRDPWVYPLGAREDARLFSAIDSMRADGG